jgi:hypothetical protein
MSIEGVSRQRYTNPDVAGGECSPLGKNLEDDFKDYHEALARLHHRALHGPGIAAGFTVEVVSGGTGVLVRPGVAVAASGQVVVLADAGPAVIADDPTIVPVPVNLPAPAANGDYVLTVALALAPLEGDRCGRLGWAAQVRLTPAGAAAPPADAVVLAWVTVAGGKVIGVSDHGSAPGAVVQRTGEAALQQKIDSLSATVVQLSKTVEDLRSQLARLAEDLRSQLARHAADHNNPHVTTAAQTGALPLTGGTLTGDLRVMGDNPKVYIRRADRGVSIGSADIQIFHDPDGVERAYVYLFTDGDGGKLRLSSLDGNDAKLYTPQG